MSEQIVGASSPKVQRVQIEGGGASDGAIVDGVSSSIKATVKDYTNANPLTVVTVDTNGDYVSGSGGTQYTEDAAAAANPVGTVPILVRADTPAGVTTTDGDNVAQRGTDYGAAYVTLLDAAGSPVAFGSGGTSAADDADFTDGTTLGTPAMGVYEATPSTVTDGDLGVVGITEDRRLKVLADLSATDNAVLDNIDADLTTIIGHVDGVEGLLGTIDADTGNISTKIDTLAGAVSGTEMQVDVLTMPTVTVTATNLDVQSGGADLATTTQAGAIQTAVELIDNTVATLGTTTYTEATSQGLVIGAVRRDADTTLVNTTNEVSPLQVDANGRLKVEAFSGETLPVSLTSTTVTGTVAVTQSGTWDEVGINDSGNSITVDNAQLSVVGGGTEAAAMRVTIASDSTGVLSIDDNGGNISIDDGGNTITVDGTVAVTGVSTLAEQQTQTTALQLIDNSIYVDDADWTADTSSHTLVGAVTQVATTANTDGDVTPLTTNAFRELRVAIPESDLATATTSHVKKYYTSAGAVTDGIIWSPAAGKRWYVTDLIINVSAAATVTLEDDLAGGDSAVMKFELAANSGISHSFNTPLYSGEDAADLLITTSAGNVYVTCVGYEI